MAARILKVWLLNVLAPEGLVGSRAMFNALSHSEMGLLNVQVISHLYFRVNIIKIAIYIEIILYC